MTRDKIPSDPEENNEQARLKALRAFRILDTPEEGSFNNFVDLACQVFDLPIAVISFTGTDRIFFKASIGLGLEKGDDRLGSIFDGSSSDEVLVINDITDSTVFANHHYVTGKFGIKFYAAVPLITIDGYRIGTLSVMHHRGIPFNERNQKTLAALGKSVMDHLEQRRLLLEDRDWKSDKPKQKQSIHKADELSEQARSVIFNGDLESSQYGFENLFEQPFIAVGLISSDKRIKAVNSSMINILELKDDVVGEAVEKLLPEDEGHNFLELLENVYSKKEAYHKNSTELRIFHEDALKTIYVDLSLQPIIDIVDGSTDILVVIKDVTDFTVAKNKLTDEMDTLAAAIEAGGFGYTVVEFATGKMKSNAQLKKNYGFSAEEDFDYPDLFDAMVPKYRQKIKELVQHAIETKTVYSGEYEVRWRDGTLHWISAHGKPRFDEHGRASHIVGINREIKK